MESRHRVVGTASFTMHSMTLEELAQSLLRFKPWGEPRIAMARSADRPQQSDGLIQSWLPLDPVHPELLDALNEVLIGHLCP